LGFDGGVDDGAGFEVKLKMEGTFWEHLTDEVGEDLLADVASEFGGLEVILEIFHRAGDFAKGAGFLFEIGDDGGGPIETGEELAIV